MNRRGERGVLLLPDDDGNEQDKDIYRHE